MSRKSALLTLAAAMTINAQPFQTQLTPWADNSIRVQIAAAGNAIQDPPLMALMDSPPNLSTSVAGDGLLQLSNGNLRVDIDPATSYVTATRISDGAVLLKQTAIQFAAPNVPGTRPGSVSAQVTFAGTAGEKVYGLGEHRTGTVNQMPYYKRFADSQDYGQSHGGDVSIPWYASSLGYGFVWNSPSYGYVNITTESITWFSNATLGVDMWITTTDAALEATVSPYANLMSNYIDAVGHAPTMPYYSTGFIQCKDRYRNQTQLLDVARGYFDRQLPISVIVIDWMHWINQGDWSFNPTCWPDPQGMFDELQTMGIELMTTFWPFQTPQATHWTQFNDSGFLTPTQTDGLQPYDGSYYLVDQTNQYVRQAVFDGFWEGYGRYGIKTIWMDAAEPEHTGSTMEGQWKFSAGTDAEVGEAWLVQHVKSFQDGFAEKGIAPSDYFVLPRHAWAGSWRYSAALWSGDIESTFAELAIQIKVLQGVMMSGPVLWTTDIGGYWGGDPTDPQFQDLIVRWFQFGAFCPLFRLHGHRDGGPPSNECGGTNGDNEVWNLAQEPTHYNGIVAMMRLRENLRNYVAKINKEAADTGMPMIRPMFLQWPQDAGCQGADVEDQYMFGPDWLVAPVYTYQAASRSVYLPALDANHTWIYYFNQTDYGQGGARVTLATPIDEFPLFFIRPLPPPTPLPWYNVTSMYSTDRDEQVLCLASQCYGDNNPGGEGNYAPQRVEGIALTGDANGNGQIVVNGTSYPIIPLNLWFSFTHNDNIVTPGNASTVPDASYLPANGGVQQDNGYILAEQAPGTLPLQLWFKNNFGAADHWDYATVASAAGIAWCQSNGYTLNGTLGYVWPASA